ncbi:MAG: SCO family protein [Terricaulis sp.]
MKCGETPTRRHVLVGGLALGAAACTPAPTGEYANLGRGLDNLVLNSSTGQDVRWRSLAGAPRALFFGFTNCPVICPVTIYELTAAAERLGAAAEDLRIDFVTVDPERDTPERMQQYFSGFGPKVTGFTGAADALAQLRTSFEITATRVPLERGGYTMDHTATVFLINRAAHVEDVIAYGSEQDVIDSRLSALLSA